LKEVLKLTGSIRWVGGEVALENWLRTAGSLVLKDGAYKVNCFWRSAGLNGLPGVEGIAKF
jgi:hypothetical protein